jgi:hypothetical protein
MKISNYHSRLRSPAMFLRHAALASALLFVLCPSARAYAEVDASVDEDGPPADAVVLPDAAEDDVGFEAASPRADATGPVLDALSLGSVADAVFAPEAPQLTDGNQVDDASVAGDALVASDGGTGDAGTDSAAAKSPDSTAYYLPIPRDAGCSMGASARPRGGLWLAAAVLLGMALSRRRSR